MRPAGRHGGADEIQLVVDELAERLGRSVVVNDALLRQVYGSRHFADEDLVRIRAILQHDAGAEAIAHILDHGIAQWRRPGRVSGSPELGLVARWCAPLWGHDSFLGTMMVIDARDDLTGSERADIETVAGIVAGHLSAEALAADTAQGERDELLRGLLSADPATRDHARDGLRGLDFPDRPFLVATVADVVSPKHTPGQIELALRGVQATVQSSARRRGTGAVAGRRAQFLQHWITEPQPADLREEAARIEQEVRRALGVSARCVVGTSAPTDSLAQIPVAHGQASVALRAARRLARFGGVAVWPALGEYASLLSVPDAAPPGSPAARALDAVRAHDPGGRLVTTLRVYLDEAGNAPRAAKALALHRTSLYYRLSRIQELTGMDLDSGVDRLALHIQLKLDDMSES